MVRHRIRLAVAALAVSVLTLFAARARAADKNELSLAAFNVEFMLDVYDDPYTQDETHEPKSRKDVEAVCKSIRNVNADVISFEELENEGVLRGMVSEYLSDMGYEYVAADTTNSDRGQNLGILSRKPILSLTSHRFLDLSLPGEKRTWRFARDLWKVQIQATPTKVVDVYVVHLKSKYDSADDPQSTRWREAEVTAVRVMLARQLKADPASLFVVMGDFNDTPESETIKTVLAPLPDKSPLLMDVHASLPAEKRISYLMPKFRSTIDYMLASPAMAKLIVPGSPRVVVPPEGPFGGGSDHAPITAKFKLMD